MRHAIPLRHPPGPLWALLMLALGIVGGLV